MKWMGSSQRDGSNLPSPQSGQIYLEESLYLNESIKWTSSFQRDGSSLPNPQSGRIYLEEN